MNDLPTEIQRQILRYKPIETEGLKLWPVRVEEYADFLLAKPAIEFMQQSLPVALMSVPLLQAYYTMDLESVLDQQTPTGLLGKTLLFLCLALRLGEGLPPEKRIRLMWPKTAPQNKKKLISIGFTLDGEEQMEITTAKFQRLRPILAAQNGIEILPEDANPELVEAEREVQRQKAPELEAKVEDLVTSIAALGGAEEDEIYGWPILKLHNRQKALRRAMDYLICGIGESQGTKWKKGNPAPHPFFDKVQTGSAGAIELDDYLGGKAAEAVASQSTSASQNPS